MNASRLLLLGAVICFVLSFLGVQETGHSLIAGGLALFAAAGLV